MEKTIYRLSEINKKIRDTLHEHFTGNFWIKAEIAELKENQGGHCYLELIEKENDEDIIARARGIIWGYTYRMLKPYFESTTGQLLQPGIAVMISASVEFHEVYGFSLIIKDIDPSFTIGEAAIQKARIIRQLKEEGVFDMNRNCPFPVVPQRIAVISSPTAAGFGDFVSHLKNNPYGYAVHYTLYPAIMQGKETESSIINALDRINQVMHRYDAVVIIRGGGAQSDLSSFNSYWLAYHICQFPLPVLTGIGHEQDETIADMVAHTRLKTPTAVADFILSHFLSYESQMEDLWDRLSMAAREITTEHKEKLNELASRIPYSTREGLFEQIRQLQKTAEKIKQETKTLMMQQTQTLQQISGVLRQNFSSCLARHRHLHFHSLQKLRLATQKHLLHMDKHLSLTENTVRLSDPELILKKGYSLTFHHRRLLKDPGEVQPGDEIETLLYKGKITSKVC